jgi:hypothetical protein
MALTVNAFSREEWQRLGLQDYADFADQITECNVGEDSFSGYGDWFFVLEGPLPNGDRVIYFGSFGNYNSPGASTYTHAEIFDVTNEDEAIAYMDRVRHWESQPEYVDEPDCDDQP